MAKTKTYKFGISPSEVTNKELDWIGQQGYTLSINQHGEYIATPTVDEKWEQLKQELNNLNGYQLNKV